MDKGTFTLQMEHLGHKKLDNMVEFTAVAIMDGIFTDKMGHTLKYTPELIEKSYHTFIGKPILHSHSEGKDDVKKVVGLIPEVWLGKHNDKLAMFYRGLVSDELTGNLIVDGMLRGSSIEADFLADTSTDPPTIIWMSGDAICLTNKPACPECTIQGYPKRVQTIKLENGGKNMGETATKQPEEILKEVQNVLKDYPMPKTKAWGEMTDDEKFGACTLFFKNKGYPHYYKAPKKVKDEITGKDVWEWPENFPEETKQLITSMEDKIAQLTKEVDDLKNEINKRDLSQVQQLSNAIKEIDPDFDPSTILKEEKCPARQKIMLEAFLVNLKRIKPKLSVGPISQSTDIDRIKKLSLEAFGQTPEELEEQLKELEGGSKS